MKMSTALDITSKIAGDEVDEAAVLNTVIPVSHLKREAAGGAKASHAIFSRMNAQRNIRWEDSQLHQGVLPPNAAMDWARLAVIARYIGEVNTRYDPKFRMLAQIRGIPYMIIRGAWAYVAETDYLVDNKAWSLVPSPDSVAVQRGALMGAYKEHAAELTKQVMRTYNELTTGAKDANLESLLRLVEQMKPKKGPKVSTLSVGTDSFAAITSHTQTAAQAAAATANSATAYNAIVSAFSDFVSPDRNLTQKAAQITALRWDFEEAYPLLGQFYPIMASSHTWIRAFEHLDSLLKNPQTSVNRLNRLHRSMTDSSATIEVDVALTAKNRKHMAPHIVAILKKVMVSRAPDNKLPRFVTDLRTAIARGHQQSLVAGLSEHFNDYRLKWAKRYEDWARVYGLAHGHRRDSILYGAAAVAFSSLTANHLLSPTSGFIDGSHLRSAYLVKMAHDYARKRKLNKPNLPPYPIASAKQLAEILDNQYAPDVSFKDCEEFARERLEMFAADLAIGAEPLVPAEDEPEEEPDAGPAGSDSDDDFDMDMLDELMGGAEVSFKAPYDRVEASYPPDSDHDAFARANGYDTFYAAWEALGEKARFDPETEFTQKGLAAIHLVAGEERKNLSGIAIE